MSESRMDRAIGRMFVAITISAIVACGGGDAAEQSGVGSCGNEYWGAALTLLSIQDVSTGQALHQVLLSDLKVTHPTAGVLPFEAAHGTGLVATDGGLLCSLPCTFGTSQGTVTMRVSKMGFESKQVTLAARYNTRTMGCPILESNGEVVSLTLRPV
jgi:hypothetical protein